MSPLQFVILAILLVVAIAAAIPEMRDANIVRVFRGECAFAGAGRSGGVRCLPHHPTATTTTTGP